MQVEYTAMPGRNPLTSGKEHLSGTSVQREQEVFKLHPDTIRRLDIGECCIIANGAYQAVRVARLPTGWSTSTTDRVKQRSGERRAILIARPPAEAHHPHDERDSVSEAVPLADEDDVRAEPGAGDRQEIDL